VSRRRQRRQSNALVGSESLATFQRKLMPFQDDPISCTVQSSTPQDYAERSGVFAVNRKQRRTAAKLGVPAVGQNGIISPSGHIADQLARGRRHHEAGQFPEAENCYRKALAIDPNQFDALHLLGVVAHQLGRSDLAARLIGKAIALHDQNPAPHNIETTHPSKAAVRRHDLAAAHANLSIVLRALSDLPGALKAIQRSLHIEETQNAKLLFVGCLRNLPFVPEGIDLRDDLIRAMSEAWGRPSDLGPFAANLVKRRGATGACIRKIAATWPRALAPRALFSPTEFAEIYSDRLLRCLLESTIVCDLELERFSTLVRRMMLTTALGGDSSQGFGLDSLRFFCAVAQQCFVNEYVFSWTDEEKQQAESLRARVVETLAAGASPSELWLVAVAAYFPLASLPQPDLLVKMPWSAPVTGLVTRQVWEVQEERRLRACVPCLTAINDDVSLAVKQQYEENPYPRWIKASPVGRTTIEAHLRQLFPLANFHNVVKTNGAEILIAGCGTGQHSIETARQFPGAQVLAIDLSLSSLCYAMRKTRELGLKNLQYAQADILKLQSIHRTFDVIEAAGVLHHLAEPMAGWQVLLSMLRPGGFMRIGLYSKLARQDLAPARALISRRGYGPSAEDVRRGRDELAGVGDGAPLSKVVNWPDFFSTSSCRDLLFHVQEHQFTLPEIDDFLRQNQLEFLGFDLPGAALQNFRRRFPNDGTITNLALWHTFEVENPSLFTGMYQFWIRKPQ
jgi:2-polyprenyl-3-methyl-5-hydroxy-6-metoxy-1,4-benzoquinol methylase/tetratricopeptide (TPR) repeat protein